MTALLEMRDITKTFPGVKALDNVNLTVEDGEIHALVGENGAGKSTLLHIIRMLDTPSSGEYHFYDRKVHKMSERQLSDLHKNHIGFIFQSFNLLPVYLVFIAMINPISLQNLLINPFWQDSPILDN